MISHEVHCLLDTLLHKFLDVPLLVLRQLIERTPRSGSSIVAGQLVVVLPRPVRHEVGVVGGGGVGHSPGAATVEVAEVVGEDLQLIGREVAVVPEYLVVARSTRPLDPLVAEQVEVTLGGVVYPLVHHGASQGVAVLVLVVVSN